MFAGDAAPGLAQIWPNRPDLAKSGHPGTPKTDIWLDTPEEVPSCGDTYMVEGPTRLGVGMPTSARLVRAHLP